MSRRRYAAHRGVSEAAVRKAIATGRITVEADGSIDRAKADRQWGSRTDPGKSRAAERAHLAAVPSPEPSPRASAGEGGFMRARTLNEAMKAQERQLRIAQMKGSLIDRNRALALVFRLARQERDAWVTWPARVAALMAADLTAALGGAVTIETSAVQQVLEDHVRAHLTELAEPRLDF